MTCLYNLMPQPLCVAAPPESRKHDSQSPINPHAPLSVEKWRMTGRLSKCIFSSESLEPPHKGVKFALLLLRRQAGVWVQMLYCRGLEVLELRQRDYQINASGKELWISHESHKQESHCRRRCAPNPHSYNHSGVTQRLMRFQITRLGWSDFSEVRWPCKPQAM